MLKQKKEARLSISAHFKVFQIKFAFGNFCVIQVEKAKAVCGDGWRVGERMRTKNMFD